MRSSNDQAHQTGTATNRKTTPVKGDFQAKILFLTNMASAFHSFWNPQKMHIFAHAGFSAHWVPGSGPWAMGTEHRKPSDGRWTPGAGLRTLSDARQALEAGRRALRSKK